MGWPTGDYDQTEDVLSAISWPGGEVRHCLLGLPIGQWWYARYKIFVMELNLCILYTRYGQDIFLCKDAEKANDMLYEAGLKWDDVSTVTL